MWTMGYKEVGGAAAQEMTSMNMAAADSFVNGRKLRPLIPRPSLSSSTTAATNTNTTTSSSTTNTTVSCLGSDIFSLNNHYRLMVGEDHQNMRNATAEVVVASSRWNPTPEQLRTLEDLYRRGTRTPSAEQIQHITAQLRRYGKIEGKNVFYWFQNHKARERQKRRRELDLLASPPLAPPRHHHHLLDVNIERKDRGPISFETQQTKNWEPSLNCSPPPATQEESGVVVSTQRTAKEAPAAAAAAAAAWGQTEGGGTHLQEQMQEREFQSHQIFHQNYATTATRNFAGEKNATWQHHMHLSYSSNYPPHAVTSPNVTHHLNTTVTSATTAITPPPILTIERNLCGNKQLEEVCGGSQEEEVPQTLQLFPLRSREERNDFVDGKEEEIKFFEFLPLINN